MQPNIVHSKTPLKGQDKDYAFYRSVVDASPSGIMIIDKEGVITFTSSKACEIFRLSKEELTNSNILNYMLPEQRSDLINRTKDLLSEGSNYDRSPITFYPSPNLVIHIEGSACLYTNEEGKKEGIIIIFNDITEKYEQAKIIQQQIEDLNAKNEELKKYIDSNLQLENFAYIASHDLKAPIRSVISFAKLLADSAHDKFSDKEQKFLKIIKDSSIHMRELIDDLLIFSRVNTTKTVYTDVDVADMIQNILADLQPDVLKYNAIIEVGDLPDQIVADKTKIRQVFQNLIANGMKFQEEGVPAVVKIDSVETKDEWTFLVSDNGIGIDPKHIDKIFLLFQKLHSKDKFEGSGMGLAICKKVIEQHNGVIYAKNNEERGCTIGFTVAKNLVSTH